MTPGSSRSLLACCCRIESGPSSSWTWVCEPAPWEERLAGVLARLDERNFKDRLRDLKAALEETDQSANPAEYQALLLEHQRLREFRRFLNQRPDTKKKHAS